MENMSEHQKKWWAKMIEVHGSEEGVRNFRRQNNAKSARNNGGQGGFNYMKRNDPDRLRVISKIAADRRWGNNEKQNTTKGKDTAKSDFFAKGKDQANQ